MFKVSPASLQTFIDTLNSVLEDRVQYSTVHIPNLFCLKYCIFCTVIVRCTETFWSPCIMRLCLKINLQGMCFGLVLSLNNRTSYSIALLLHCNSTTKAFIRSLCPVLSADASQMCPTHNHLETWGCQDLLEHCQWLEIAQCQITAVHGPGSLVTKLVAM